MTVSLPNIAPATEPVDQAELVAKLQDQVLSLTRDRDLQKAERIAAEIARDDNHNRAEGFWEQLTAKHKDMESMRRTKGEVAGDRDRWKARAEKAEAATPAGLKAALDKVDALQGEVSSLHRRLNQRDAEVEDAVLQTSIVTQKHREIESKNVILMSTLEQMQRARDVAQAREVVAFEKLHRAEADLAKALQAHADLEVGTKMVEKIIFDVASAHEKGHPKPVDQCAICLALGHTPEKPKVA